MADHVDNPPELIDPPPCDCCGVPSTERRTSIWHQPSFICHPCFWIWYEYGYTKRDKIKSERLRLFSTRDVLFSDPHEVFDMLDAQPSRRERDKTQECSHTTSKA